MFVINNINGMFLREQLVSFLRKVPIIILFMTVTSEEGKTLKYEMIILQWLNQRGAGGTQGETGLPAEQQEKPSTEM